MVGKGLIKLIKVNNKHGFLENLNKLGVITKTRLEVVFCLSKDWNII